MTLQFLTRLADRAVIEITGPDARSFLQRVITHGPENVSPDRAVFSALLTPQGKIIADFFIFDNGQDGLLLDIPTPDTDDLIKRFSLYRLRSKAEISKREDLAVAAGLGTGEEELKTVAISFAPDPRSDRLGIRAIVPAGGPVDMDQYEYTRILAGLPEYGKDYRTSEVFPTDVNHDLMNGIDYKKGCFVGQEVASRMHRKGGVRKRTIVLEFEDGAPAAGQPVMAGDVTVGEITSRSDHHALARVRVDRLESSKVTHVSSADLNAEWRLPESVGNTAE